MSDQTAKGLFDSLLTARPQPQPVRPETEAKLLAGDRAPEFVLPDPETKLHNFYDLAGGRPVVLVLAANTARQDQWDEIKGYAEVAPALEEAGVRLVIVSNDGVESLAMVSKIIPEAAVWLADVKGVVNLALRTGARFEASGIASFLLDANQRVIDVKGPGRGHAPWALAAARALTSPEPRTLSAVAPVLILPRVLDEATCRRLLAERGAAGAPTGDALAAALSREMLRRVGPEVDKVFSFDDFKFEQWALREDEEGVDGAGIELRRDNPDPEGTGRSFSLFIDLDAAAYSGGGWRFPEYGPHLYRPDTGAALVHAGALFRELLPPDAGRRSLLTLTLRRPKRATSSPAA